MAARKETFKAFVISFDVLFDSDVGSRYYAVIELIFVFYKGILLFQYD